RRPLTPNRTVERPGAADRDLRVEPCVEAREPLAAAAGTARARGAAWIRDDHRAAQRHPRGRELDVRDSTAERQVAVEVDPRRTRGDCANRRTATGGARREDLVQAEVGAA